MIPLYETVEKAKLCRQKADQPWAGVRIRDWLQVVTRELSGLTDRCNWIMVTTVQLYKFTKADQTAYLK